MTTPGDGGLDPRDSVEHTTHIPYVDHDTEEMSADDLATVEKLPTGSAMLLVQRGLEGERLVHRDQRERLHSRAERLPAGELLDRLSRINDTERAIEQMANARLSLETLLLRLVQS